MKDKRVVIDCFCGLSRTYLEILAWYRSEIGWFFDSGANSIHTVPFLLTCAVAFECSLNDHLIEHYSDSNGSFGQLRIPGLLSMSFKGKLINVVPFLTANRFMINVEHKIYQDLANLIKVRNQLVHNKGSYESHEGIIKEEEDRSPFIEIPQELKKSLSSEIDPTFGIKGDVGRYHDSLERFHEMFFDVLKSDDFIGNELIVPIEEGSARYGARMTIVEPPE